MKIAVYGGSFDPPHLGHVEAARAACAQLDPDKLLVIPACIPPHKTLSAFGGNESQRLQMARLAFSSIACSEVSDMEMRRGGKSYTSDTLKELKSLYGDAELVLLVGTDMFLSLENWHEGEWILANAAIGVFPREDGDVSLIRAKADSLKAMGADVSVIEKKPLPAASTDIRALLKERRGRELLHPEVYAYIISERLYGARPEFEWLRRQAYAMLKPKRIPHVKGCEEEAVRLARRWGADADAAAEAGILHDITKKLSLDEQLILCDKYGIIADEIECASEKLLHAKTGAAVARALFGVSDEVYNAIKWHTTGKADMSLLEKIIYMADYIEPNRCFDGVDKLRELAYADLDSAMLLGFEMSLEDIESRGIIPHANTLAAFNWYKEGKHL